jgi:hypothetical protein
MHRRTRLKAIAVVNLLILCYTKARFWLDDELKHVAMNLNICVVCVTDSLCFIVENMHLLNKAVNMQTSQIFRQKWQPKNGRNEISVLD